MTAANTLSAFEIVEIQRLMKKGVANIKSSQ